MKASPEKPESPWILAINGGSSSIKFAVHESGGSLRRIWEGAVERIGMPEAVFRVKALDREDGFSRPVDAPDHAAAVGTLIHWTEDVGLQAGLASIGHRVVHGGPDYTEPRIISSEMISELRRLSPFDPEHLPTEILLIRAFQKRFPDLPQVACFDTAFHHDMPRVAQILPIPRRYEALGVRRYGFHGLSFAFLMGELHRLAGPDSARGRIILAHLGNGASLAAVNDGIPIDTSMGFTPASGLVMGTRSGDLDPGIFSYLSRTEGMTEARFQRMVNHESGMRGISETDSDMRGLLAREAQDVRAAEAIGLFCYQTRKWIGAFAAALGGLDTLVFSGGIGEHAPVIRARICEGLGFLGIDIDEKRNDLNAEVISTDSGKVSVRVIHTDEELRIVQLVTHILKV
ncbi:MAG: acetate/propionate family kinase [Fibrobacteria bacterium]